jgi:hypothetical protein
MVMFIAYDCSRGFIHNLICIFMNFMQNSMTFRSLEWFLEYLRNKEIWKRWTGMGFTGSMLQCPGVRRSATITGQKAEAACWGWPSPWPRRPGRPARAVRHACAEAGHREQHASGGTMSGGGWGNGEQHGRRREHEGSTGEASGMKRRTATHHNSRATWR